MIRRLIEFALTQRLFVSVLAVGAVAFGLYAYVELPIDAFPAISPTQVKIILKAPGMTPEEVESRVIMPLEAEILGIPRKTNLRSSAKYAIADITLDFEEGTDVFWARNQVSERLNAAREFLPSSITGGLAPISTPLSDVLMFTIEGDGLTLEERRSLMDWKIRPALRTIPGVADVNILGGYVKTFEIVPNNAALVAAGLTTAAIAEAVRRNNGNDGAGRVSQGDEALVVRTVGAMSGIDDLAATVIRSEGGRVIRLRDIAKVRTGTMTRYGSVSRSGKDEAVEGIVIAMLGANANKVVQATRAKLSALEEGLPAGAHLNIFYDRSELIGRAMSTVEHALIEATVLVVILLLVFLGNLRAALVVALMLPLAALMTFIMMRLFGLTANLMSLGGLAIAIGMLVDGAVVVVENSVEHLARQTKHDMVPKQHRLYHAAVEVSVPVVSGICIISLVFLPLLSLQGLEGKLFSPVALTIIFALTGSLLLSMTLVPILCSWLLLPGHHREAWIMKKISPLYAVALEWALSHARKVFGAAFLLLFCAIFASFFIGKTFMPTMDEGGLLLQLVKHPSITLDHSVKVDMAVQRELLGNIPEIQDVVARVGSDEIGLDPMGLNETDAFLVLKPKSQWRIADKDWLIDQIRKVMTGFPGIGFAFTQPIEMRVAEMLTGSRGDLAIKIFGNDQKILGDLGGLIQEQLVQIKGAREVYTTARDNMQYLTLKIDREDAGRSGLSVQQVQEELRASVEGMNAGLVAERDRRTAIIIRGDHDLRDSPSQFERLELATPDGGRVHLSSVVSIERPEGAVKLARENAARFAVVLANVSGRDLVSFVEEAQSMVKQNVHLPSGYSLEWGGQFENQRRAAQRLAVVVPIALALIFLVLFATLRSVRQAALILANIPFALVGGVLALWVTGEYLSVPASVGFIALLGIAVLNGLVLVSHFNQRHDSGQDIQQVVFDGAQRRLRPVLMTAAITAFGLVPLLFSSGPGSEIQKPLAIVVIGGLISSTVLTLIVLPLLYRSFGIAKSRVEGRK